MLYCKMEMYWFVVIGYWCPASECTVTSSYDTRDLLPPFLCTITHYCRSHLALISEDPVETQKSLRAGQRPSGPAVIVGMVTFEDVIEQLLQGDIEDETDHIVRMKHNEQEEEEEAKKKEKVRSFR